MKYFCIVISFIYLHNIKKIPSKVYIKYYKFRQFWMKHSKLEEIISIKLNLQKML
jgi:hypothetical protein